VVAEEATNQEVDTLQEEVDTNSKAITITTETKVAGETKVHREEEDMAAVVAMVDGAILDVMTTGIGTRRKISVIKVGVRAEVGTVAHLPNPKGNSHTPTMEEVEHPTTSDHELQDHQEVMHQSSDKLQPEESKMDQAASFT